MPVISGARGAVTLPDGSMGRTRRWAFDRGRRTEDTSGFEDADIFERPIAVSLGGTFEVEALFNETALAAIETRLQTVDDAGAAFTLTTRNTSGGKKYSFTGVITGHSVRGEKRGLYLVGLSGEISGAVTEAAVP